MALIMNTHELWAKVVDIGAAEPKPDEYLPVLAWNEAGWAMVMADPSRGLLQRVADVKGFQRLVTETPWTVLK